MSVTIINTFRVAGFGKFSVLHQRSRNMPLLRRPPLHIFHNKPDLARGGHYFSEWSALRIMKNITLALFSWS